MGKKDEPGALLPLNEAESKALAPINPNDMAGLIRFALEQPGNVETVERLVGLAERLQDRAAAQEFNAALARFQDECPAIRRESIAKIATRAGSSYSYRYAELDEIVKTIKPHLKANGLSYTWDSTADAGNLVCTCTLRHINGHKETASFLCPVASASAMSEQQKYASALSFSKRQSLISVLGLTSTDPDTDGGESAGEKITESQVADLESFIQEAGADRAKFLKYLSVERVEDIRDDQYAGAVQALEAKRRKA